MRRGVCVEMDMSVSDGAEIMDGAQPHQHIQCVVDGGQGKRWKLPSGLLENFIGSGMRIRLA